MTYKILLRAVLLREQVKKNWNYEEVAVNYIHQAIRWARFRSNLFLEEMLTGILFDIYRSALARQD